MICGRVSQVKRLLDLIVAPIPFADGFTPTPMAPGLGCELDMEALARYTQRHEQVA